MSGLGVVGSPSNHGTGKTNFLGSLGLVMAPGDSDGNGKYNHVRMVTATPPPSPAGNNGQGTGGCLGLHNDEKVLSISNLQQLLQAITAKNQYDDVKEILNAMANQIQMLTEQVRQLQVVPPISKESGGFMGQTVVVPQTPRKLSPPYQCWRQDITPPEEANSRIHSPGQLPVADVLKRSLQFPRSLGELLDKRVVTGSEAGAGVFVPTKVQDACIQTEAGHGQIALNFRSFDPAMNHPYCNQYQPQNLPPPVFQQIKQEVTENQTVVGSSQRISSFPSKSLLVLANVALSAERNSNRSLLTNEILPDSGRSSGTSGSSNCGESPASYKYNVRAEDGDGTGTPKDKSIGKSKYRVVKASHSSEDMKLRIVRPKSPGNSQSSTDETENKSAPASSKLNSRKRRKPKQPLPCKFCGKLFNNQSSLRQHESFHSPYRPFKCEHDRCDKAYKTRSELNRHLVVHSGEKQHACKLCGKRFLRKQYLKTHLVRHHELESKMISSHSRMDKVKEGRSKATSGPPPSLADNGIVLAWKCKTCSKVFATSEDRAEHIRRYHEKNKDDKKQPEEEMEVEQSSNTSNSSYCVSDSETASTTSTSGEAEGAPTARDEEDLQTENTMEIKFQPKLVASSSMF